MRVLVTGSGGYIAQGVIKRLLEDGCSVYAWGRHSCGIQHPALVERQCDIFEDTFTFVDEPIPDALLHLAWSNGFKHDSSTHMEMLPKHLAFIETMVDCGIPQIAIMGSMHELGYHEGEVNEDSPCNPSTPYAVAKNELRIQSEEICRKKNVVWQWLRGFYLYSADGRGDSIFSKIVRAAQENKGEFPFTTGQNCFDFLSYDEFCMQIARTVEQSEIAGIINICSGKPMSLASKIEEFIKDNNFDIRLLYGTYPDRPYDSPAIWGDSSKIERILKAGEKA